MQDKSPSKPISFIRRHKVALIILTPIAILLLLAYGIPVIVGDGTGRFSGDKRKVAESSIKYLNGVSDSIDRFADLLSGEHYYIENVVELTPEEAQQKCKLQPDENATGYYDVYISKVKMFGGKSQTSRQTSLATCDISQKIKNTP